MEKAIFLEFSLKYIYTHLVNNERADVSVRSKINQLSMAQLKYPRDKKKKDIIVEQFYNFYKNLFVPVGSVKFCFFSFL